MRASITNQLFAVMLGLCLLMIVAMGTATIWSMRQGFNDYTRQQDRQRAEAVAATLAELYRQQGSWRIIKQNPRLWRDILSMDNPERSQLSSPNPRPDLGEPERRPLVPHRMREHWSLMDAQGHIIAGNPKPTTDALRFGIKIGGEYVGELMVSNVKRRFGRTEQHFLEQQRRSGLLIMLLSAFVALITALLLARRFLAPIHQLAHATHQLSAGQYDVQIPVTRQDEFGQLAKDFNRLAQILGQNERLRRDFVADISHELRTPLAILTGELEAIQDGIRKPTPEAMSSLRHEVNALTRLVDDLYQLALSDIGGLRYHMHEIDLAKQIKQAAQPFMERMAEHQLQLELELPTQSVWVMADAERINQLITNLLENSIRYTDAGGKVQLQLQTTAQHVVIDCQDSAPSVSPEDLPRLFERLYRVEGSRNRATGGAGLGLPLCQSIIEAHQGQITAQISPLGGLWLQIQLPRLPPTHTP
ncbi:MAG: ATP-binding protein [Pseudomonadota bacterium]|nr:ATP-binding protein [Pseudomonadota bacterium]